MILAVRASGTQKLVAPSGFSASNDVVDVWVGSCSVLRCAWCDGDIIVFLAFGFPSQVSVGLLAIYQERNQAQSTIAFEDSLTLWCTAIDSSARRGPKTLSCDIPTAGGDPPGKRTSILWQQAEARSTVSTVRLKILERGTTKGNKTLQCWRPLVGRIWCSAATRSFSSDIPRCRLDAEPRGRCPERRLGHANICTLSRRSCCQSSRPCLSRPDTSIFQSRMRLSNRLRARRRS